MMKRMGSGALRRFLVVGLSFSILAAGLLGCQKAGQPQGSSAQKQAEGSAQKQAEGSAQAVEIFDKAQAEKVLQELADKPNKLRITLEDERQIDCELYPDIAPISVANFKRLVNEKFYDGKTFFRCIPGFMIQGGEPKPGEQVTNIRGEFSANGIDNPLKHEDGVLSMARAQDFNSASTQFFIMDGTAKHLDGQYAAFGKVTAGLDVVHEIAALNSDGQQEYLNKPVGIKSISFLED